MTFLTLKETAALLKISVRSLQRLINLGTFPAFKVGGQWRVNQDSLDTWVKTRSDAAAKNIAPRTKSGD